MVGYIYLITDTTNGMKYTGKHHYHIEGQLDPSYHGSGTIIKNIYKKRPETLKEEYIKTCYSEEEMCSDEQYYIKLFKTLWPNGYNLTEGGDGLIPCEETRRKLSLAQKGKHVSSETRKKISDYRKGKHHTEETKKKLSNSHKGLFAGEKHPMFGKHHTEESKRKNRESNLGKPSPNKGKHHTEETKKKISNANKGKHLSEETKKKISAATKGLLIGDKNPMYGKKPSLETRQKISNANKGKHLSEETKKKLSNAHKGKHHTEETKKKLGKTVFQFSLDGIFICEWYSINEAQNKLGIKHISDCCNGKRKSAGGFKWCYA